MTTSKCLHILSESKHKLLLECDHLDRLLLPSDLAFSRERASLIEEMRAFDKEIGGNEREIGALLGRIAHNETVRSEVSEEREEHYLRTIEFINMADIKIERENMEGENAELDKRHAQLKIIEAEYVKEKERVDEKKRRRRLGALLNAGSPGK